MYILVDEFQDTSLGRYALLDLLTAGWSDGDGHTLFLVGDPMQSIYHFREAEVGLFLRAWHARRLGSVRLHPLTLTVNFRSEKGVVDWVNAAFGALMPAADDPAVRADRGDNKHPLPRWIADRIARKRDNEVVRLLYVAATRAIRKLHLVGHVRVGEDKDGSTIMKEPSASTLLGVLWPVVAATFERIFAERDPADAHEATTTVTATQPSQLLRRLPLDWQPAPSPAPVVIVPRHTDPDHALDEHHDTEDTDPETRALARQVGIVVHAMLERLADRHDLPTAIDAEHIDMIRRLLEREGVAAADLDTAVQHVRRAVDNTLSHERGRLILFAHAQAKNELSLTGTIDGQLVNIRIDRTFIDPTGTRWIIDYKTTLHTSTVVEPFLASRLILHQAQLTRYAGMIQLLAPSDNFHAALWHTEFNRLSEP